MKGLTPIKIAAACHGTLYNGESLKEKEIESITIDSRKVEKDGLFIPIKGARVDGHDFIPQVREAGAMLVLSEKELPGKEPYILVESSAQALKDLAEYYLEVLDIPVVGITGSVGKTSTKEMIASVLSEKFNVLKTEGNYNNEIGLPLTVFRLREEHQIAVLEMGISDFGEMSRLGKIAKPDVMVITNIGLCHLENLKSRDGILKAKTEVFDQMPYGALAILNGDDDKLCTIKEVKGRKPVFFGLHSDKSVVAENIKNLGFKGTKCRLCTEEGCADVLIPIPGEHMVQNALAATAVGLAFDMELSDICAGISRASAVSGRLNVVETGKYTVIDDCYNANPVSMKASLKLLSDVIFSPKVIDRTGADAVDESSGNGEIIPRKVAILGDMFELGTDEIKLHQETGIFAADCKLDVLIFVGELARKMCEAAEEECKILTEKRQKESRVTEIYYFASVEECLEKLPDVLCDKDTILIKASHGMGFARIVSGLTE